MRDRKSLDDFLDTERPKVFNPQKGREAEIGWSAEKLGVLGQASDIQPLRKNADNENRYVQFAVANALRNLGDTEYGKKILWRIANETEHYYSRKAAQMLARAGIAGASDRLHALDNPPHQQYTPR